MKKTNPVIYADFPDPDIIRVGDTYYMANTTMQYMPGCDILRSYDLLHWEWVAHAHDRLEDLPSHRLEEGNIFGLGMWAPSFRYHNGRFYITFTANDTKKTYLLTAEDPAGPWEKRTIEGFYYDNGLFFDDDGRVYIVHGQKTLRITELLPDLSGPKPGGLERIAAVDSEDAPLGFEGSHMQKANGKYYLFTCHMLLENGGMKTEDCFVADSLDGEFRHRCIINDDMGYHRLGVAQGGMIDTPEGDWYLFMFQDCGALGRAPMLLPMVFDEDGFPAIAGDGRVPKEVTVLSSARPDDPYAPLYGDDDFRWEKDETGKPRMPLFWQFCHNPANGLWSVTEREGFFRIRTRKTAGTPVLSQNILTQRAFGPRSSAEVTLDGSALKNGDTAGLISLIGCFGTIALSKEDGAFFLVMQGKPAKNDTVYGDDDFLTTVCEYERKKVSSPVVTLRCDLDLSDKKDEARFFYRENGEWHPLGITQKMYFKMDHFTGCRFGLFCQAAKTPGGAADFTDFKMTVEEDPK